MNDKKQNRRDEVMRLLTWIGEHPDEWYKVCSSEGEFMSSEECAEYIREMREKELYPMIAVLLENNMGQREVGWALGRFLLKALMEKCDRDGVEQFFRDMEDELHAAAPR